MSHLLFYYERPEPATWVFLASFLLLSIYFVFNRFLSIRNLDVMLLLFLAPGLMMVYEGRRLQLSEPIEVQAQKLVDRAAQNGGPAPSIRLVTFSKQEADQGNPPYVPKHEAKPYWNAESLQFWGFVALLTACGLLLIRMVVDPALVRRPLLIPNLSIGGLSFIGISLFVFLMGNIVTSNPREQQVRGPQLSPGYLFLKMLPQLPTTPDQSQTSEDQSLLNPSLGGPRDESLGKSEPRWLSNLARGIAILSNFVVIFSIVGVGYWHFDNIKTGIGCAVMYLLLPYAAQMTGNLEHVVPAALLSLALLTYRQPWISGSFMGLAAGLVYYPLFLLPLWISFYWKRGLSHWLSGVSLSLVVLSALLLIDGWQGFLAHLQSMFGLWMPRMEGMEGIWGPGRIQADFRLPVLVAFILFSFAYAAWPPRKNLATLMSGTAAVMLAAQFWHGNGGGLYMAWFLPFVLLTVFRPNLDDRIATSVVKDRAATLQ